MPRENASQLPRQQPRPTFLSAWAIRCVETTFIASFTLGAAPRPTFLSAWAIRAKNGAGEWHGVEADDPKGGTLFYNRGRASLTRGTDAPLPYDPKGVERPRGLPGGDGAAGAVQWCILAMVGPPLGPISFCPAFPRGRFAYPRL